MWTRMALLAWALSMAAWTPARATEADPHKVYEVKCQGCHFEHGADLARLRLKLDKGVLTVSRTGQSLDRVLARHHGVALQPAEQQALGRMFTNGIAWAGTFQHRCASCHGKAVEFARDSLALRDGQLVAKRTGGDVAEILGRHGEATPDEQKILLEMLRFQLGAAPRP